MGNVPATDAQRLDELWHWVNGMQQTVNHLAELQQRLNSSAAETGEHADLIVDQLWRRLEAADARLATEVQVLSTSTSQRLQDLEYLALRLKKENAAILRILGRQDLIEDADDDIADQLPIARSTLFAEIEGGVEEERSEKLQRYLPYFADAQGPVVDLGCGEGEFVALLRDQGREAYGIDLEEDAVERGRANGLDLRHGDLFAHLESLEDGSLGGAFSAQVVEHLPAQMLAPLFELLYRKLRSGARVVVETPNPATFATHVHSFWRDPTHTRPVPLPALDFDARTAGFVSEQTIYSSPTPMDEKLQRIELEPHDPMLRELVSRFNQNAEKLDDLLYGWQDYALVVRKP